MLKVRQILFATALLLPMATLPVLAQTPNSPPPTEGQGRPGAGRRMAELLKGITLSPAQQTKIDSIQTAYRAKMPAFTPGAPPDSATRAQGRALMHQANEDIRAVLTADQQVIWDKNLATMRANRPQGGGPS